MCTKGIGQLLSAFKKPTYFYRYGQQKYKMKQNEKNRKDVIRASAKIKLNNKMKQNEKNRKDVDVIRASAKIITENNNIYTPWMNRPSAKI